MAALIPALASAVAPYAFQAAKTALPTLTKVLGNNLYALGKPSVDQVLKSIGQKVRSQEGRKELLGLVGNGLNVGHNIANEGLDLAEQLGLSKNVSNRLRGRVETGKKNLHNLLGILGKVNKRIQI